jgi:hypothetical protein
MRKQTAKNLALNKETLRSLVDVPGKVLENAAGGTSYPLNCTNSNCPSCGNSPRHWCCF